MNASHHKPEFYFFLFLLFWVFLLVFFIFLPFIQVLVLAMVLATTFAPLYKKVLNITKNHRDFAAIISTLIILALVVVPIVFLGVQIIQEATQLYSSLINDGVETYLPNVLENLSNIFPQVTAVLSKVSFDADQHLKTGLQWFLQNIGSVFSSATGIIIDFFILVIALYYLLKDGEKLKKFIISLSPLPDIYDEQISEKLRRTVSAAIRGILVVALIQGVLTSIGFTIFGVPKAVLWGSVASIASLIPGVGTSLVLIPGIFYLFFTSTTFYAFGLLVWGVVAVGLIDNYLGPKLVERGVGIHPLVILLSILGGISFFGPIGILFGPLALSLFFALLDVYRMMVDEAK